MSYLDHLLRIIMVQLPDAALKSHRVLNDGNPDLYPVVVGLNRPVDEYERKELADFHIERGDTARMAALIEDTTLENIRDNIDECNSVLDSAVEKARQAGRPLR
jgi:hypothetical protein